MDRLDHGRVPYLRYQWKSAWTNPPHLEGDMVPQHDGDEESVEVDVFSIVANPCGTVFVELVSINPGACETGGAEWGSQDVFVRFGPTQTNAHGRNRQ